MSKRIYPEIDIKKTNGTTLETYLRKQDVDGTWYLCLFRKSNGRDDMEYPILCQMIMEIERFKLFGVIDKRNLLQLESGENIHEVDENQESEYERFAHDKLFFPSGHKMQYCPEIPNEEVDKINKIIMV